MSMIPYAHFTRAYNLSPEQTGSTLGRVAFLTEFMPACRRTAADTVYSKKQHRVVDHNGWFAHIERVADLIAAGELWGGDYVLPMKDRLGRGRRP